MFEAKNTLRITQTAATVAALMGIDPPQGADMPNPVILKKAESVFGMKKVERALLYNPDAIALWLFQKYTEHFGPVLEYSELTIPVLSVMPAVTPVCFASMYSGLIPEKHGIRAYVKPVLQVETLFDAAILAGKKPIIISTKGDSISEIFKERKMDYIFCDTPQECNSRAVEVLKQDAHDIVVVYNGNYDSQMHRTGTESEEALTELRNNAKDYALLRLAAGEAWKGHRCIAGFLPDHGCHDIDGGCGSHGLDMPEDMDIVHFFSFFE